MKTTLRTQLSLLFAVSVVGACAQGPVNTSATVNAPAAAAAPTPALARAAAPAPRPAPAVVAAPPPVVPAPSPPASTLNSEYEAFFNEAVQLINQYRARRNLSALSRDNRLDKLASAHSRYMAAKDDLSHDGFNERFNQANMQSCAENVAWNQITAAELVNDWIASPVHDKNLLKPNVTRVGMGRAKGYTAYFVCQP